MFFFDSHSAMVLVGISGGKRTGNGNSFLYSVIVYTDCVCVRVCVVCVWCECVCVSVWVWGGAWGCGCVSVGCMGVWGVCACMHVCDTCMHHTRYLCYTIASVSC